MYIPFEQLSDQARIWIYQANRSLTLQEQEAVLQASKTLVATWTSHERPLQGSAHGQCHQFATQAQRYTTHRPAR